MKKIARYAAIAGLSAFGLAFAAGIAVRFLLPPETARLLVERQLEAKLHRQVTLGSLRIEGLSTFRVDGIAVSESPTFQDGRFLSAETFELTARLFPLLFRKVMIKEVVLRRPSVAIVRFPDGRLNVAPAAGEKPGGERRMPSGDLLISEVRLESGTVAFVDRSDADLSARLEDVNVTLSHVSLTAPVAMSGSARASMRGVDADVSFDAAFDPLKGDAALERFDVSSGSAALSVAGRANGLYGESPDFTGTLRWTGLDPSSFTALVPVPEGLSVKGPTNGRLELAGKAPEAKSRLEADMSGAEVRWKTIVHKEAGVPLSAAVSVDRSAAGEVSVRDFLIKLASIEARGDGVIRGSTTSARMAAFRVETNEFEVADLFRNVNADLPAPLSLNGPVRVSASMEGWTGGGRFVADIDGTRLSAAYGGAFSKAPGVALRLVADGRYATPLAVDFGSIRLDLDAMSMNGRGSYTTGKVRPTYVFRFKTNAFPLSSAGALMPAAAPYKPTGRAVVAMRVSRGREGPALSGTATLLGAGFRIKQAALSDVAGTLAFSDDEIDSGRLTGRIAGEPLQAEIRASKLKARPFIEAEVSAAKLDLGKIFPAPQKTWLPRELRFPFPVAVAHAAAPFVFDTRGEIKADEIVHPFYGGKDLTLTWNLTSVTADLSRVSGRARLRQGPGSAKNVKSMIDQSKAARLVLGPLAVLQKVDAATNGALKIPSLENFAFEAASGDYIVKAGVANVAPFVIDGPIGIRVEGTAGLAGEQPLELKATLSIASEELQGAVGRALAALGGRHTLRLRIGGTAARPDVAIDKEDLERKAGDVLRKLGESLFGSP